MIKKILIIISLIVFSSTNLYSQSLYGGLGGNYFLPFGDFNQTNEDALGINIHLEKRFCNLWYGVNFDYASFDRKGEVLQTDSYIENIISIAPTVKFNYMCLVRECNSYNFFPYVMAAANISSITSTDNLGKLGIGLSPGFGFAHSFMLYGQCMMIDGNVQYMLPNAIYRDEGRENIETLKVGLYLSIRI